MAEINTRNLIISIGGHKYKMAGTMLEDICGEIGISETRFVELLSRDAYCPVLSAAPTSSTLTYTDTDGSANHFAIGQSCVYPSAESSDGYSIAILKATVNGAAVWQDLGSLESSVSESSEASANALAYAQQADSRSTEAVNTANAARDAVATLEGLADTTTAQETLAAQVMQIAENTSDIEVMKAQHVLLSEEEYEALELPDTTKIYMVYEE